MGDNRPRSYLEGMCPTLSATDTMNNSHHGKGKSHSTLESLWENLYYKGVIDTGIKNISGYMFPKL